MGRFLEVGWGVCLAQCRVVEGDLQFLPELLDVCPAVCVAEHAGEMLDGVGVMVCSVVVGIGGVLWYPVRGLMVEARLQHSTIPILSTTQNYRFTSQVYSTFPFMVHFSPDFVLPLSLH